MYGSWVRINVLWWPMVVFYGFTPPNYCYQLQVRVQRESHLGPRPDALLNYQHLFQLKSKLFN